MCIIWGDGEVTAGVAEGGQPPTSTETVGKRLGFGRLAGCQSVRLVRATSTEQGERSKTF